MGRLCFSVILGVLAMALLASPGQSLTCTSQKFSNNLTYANCTDLPHLSAYLHWNYNASNSSLSIAFQAPPATAQGWVSWGINPNGTGMLGSQALVALKSDGKVAIQTYDIQTYAINMTGTKLSYEVWDLRAEESSGTFKIFGNWKLPAKTEKVNQVWQVGPAVDSKGYPTVHAMQPANLNSKGTLNLVSAAVATSPASEPTASGPSGSPTPSGEPAGSTPTARPSGSNTPSGSSRIRERLGAGFYVPLIAILGSLIVF